MLYTDPATPPRCGRHSSSSTSPDSLYKSTDSSRGLTFSSPDSETSKKSPKQNFTIATKFLAVPKINFDEDSDDNEWNPGLASPIRRLPTLRKISRGRSRLSTSNGSPALFTTHSENDKDVRISASPITTPPHKRLRALQITDVVTHSPQYSPSSPARRKLSPRAVLFGSAKKPFRHSPLRASSAKKPSVNPFTPPNTNNQNHITSASYHKAHPTVSDSGYVADESWNTGDSTVMETDNTEHTSIHNSAYSSSQEKLALREMFTSRYKEEFCEECVVGSGEFGTVFKCVNKLDGCTYAIKRSREPVAGSAFEQVARNEVYAHAVLGKHSHVVRYYSAWAENGHLYIQNEYCNGGSLAEEIHTHRKRGTRFTESELKDILKQVSHGLKYIHAQQLAHMDIKPGNIFIQYNACIIQSPESGIEDDSSDSEFNDRVTYKIGDFGHVTSLFAHDIEEGDCRYMPREILNDEHRYLCKADIFALGLTAYQAAALKDLPKNGDEWHKIRDGELDDIPGYSKTLNNLLKSMVHPDPSERPSAAMLSSHPDLCPVSLWSKKQLARKLSEERHKNEILSKQLAAVQESAELNHFGVPFLPDSMRQNIARATSSRSSRLIGIKCNRSKSLTNF